MPKQSDESLGSRGLSSHILPTAGTMIGACATLIGLVKVAEGHIGPSHVDEYVALTMVPFLISVLASYMSIRHEATSTSQRYERIADLTFLFGLLALSLVSAFFAYELV